MIKYEQEVEMLNLMSTEERGAFLRELCSDSSEHEYMQNPINPDEEDHR